MNEPLLRVVLKLMNETNAGITRYEEWISERNEWAASTWTDGRILSILFNYTITGWYAGRKKYYTGKTALS